MLYTCNTEMSSTLHTGKMTIVEEEIPVVYYSQEIDNEYIVRSIVNVSVSFHVAVQVATLREHCITDVASIGLFS